MKRYASMCTSKAKPMITKARATTEHMLITGIANGDFNGDGCIKRQMMTHNTDASTKC